METSKLKKFAQLARRTLIEQVSTKLALVLAEGSAARRESVEAIKKLEEVIQQHGKEQVIERVAYIWFNRLCALRFMDVNRYTRIGVVSPADGQFQPEILAEAKMGHIDEEMVPEMTRQQIFALLNGKAPSHDPQGEVYRLLLVAACNDWNRAMPFLFGRIDDYTELLMPDDLLSGNSILAYTREAMTPDACEDVEVIGWLYQFYISEKKDEVFDGLKKNKKITPENIPAATQLFTPHWIVRYLVENSLGRLWLLNRSGSKLVEQMDYYIKPEQAETDFLRIGKPEEIRICDPACGSGHMLTYAFDLLYAIYEEEGYEPAEIPEKILTNNLYGIEIDERAGELAAFALTMKARAKQRRFFNKGVKPNICVLENVRFDEGELKIYMDFVGRDLFIAPLQTTLRQFEEANNFGSLIRPDVTDVDGMLRILESKNVSGQLFISMTHQKVLQALRQADYLSPKYHVVIANPPYMGGRNMNGRLAGWLKDNYADVKSDLFSAFFVRNTELSLPKGQLGFMSPFVWMFISSYEKLRSFLINQKTITSLVQLEYSGFDGATVPICTFTIENTHRPDFKGGYIRLSNFRGSENQAPKTLEAINNPECDWFFRASAANYKKIPGCPISYDMPEKLIEQYEKDDLLRNYVDAKSGQNTGDNSRFVKFWFEPSFSNVGFGAEALEETECDTPKWYPYNKGGEFRKWYGNFDNVVNWANNGREIKEYAVIRNNGGHWSRYIQNLDYMLREGITWTFISSSYFGARYTPAGHLFDYAGCSAFPKNGNLKKYIGYFCSGVAQYILKFMNPTLNLQPGNVSTLPEPVIHDLRELEEDVDALIALSKKSWDSMERSWDFLRNSLIEKYLNGERLSSVYKRLRDEWSEEFSIAIELEKRNKKRFIDSFDLNEIVSSEVNAAEVTLDSNPYYRYGHENSADELEALLLSDTMRELVSYAVGCMFGRYALDKPGLILANHGETIADYLKRVPEPSFPADDDNVIPMLDGDWFTDDIAERFRKFLRVAFGEEHYAENLQFIEKALGKNGKPRDIRDYFLKDFYSDHVKRYKKRPIYWLFSSPKGSFNALIYMHRYRPDTVSVVLNDYLREFRTKLTSHKNHLESVSISASASQGEKTKALKEIEKSNKMIAEMEEYEREVLYPLATEQVEINLDDGVKVNYPKLGAALKKIVGLDAADE
ncbi:MAG: BREX-1 system adenine-specific DNA-methyltransferase PglX [Deltaproteobacteria bacterium]|jgi:type II restriction/modification system DNA methylase subunit YeeA|uniref:BREX-1 system adenine-specific DNA-methyltransferase PglX n=1 Tax=Hydrosulfovibrio ferrireducens TaxID=2934181 RepID=UPI00121E320C|nr:MAG: BREX-1 system adenine-specific DNA-methyltransferase PglX [Deltaproteobacteria bacterium]